MPSPRRYHHGDLPAALRAATLDLVAERGPHGFSLAEAARRAGVTSASPYRHFADKETLLADIAVDAYAGLRARLAGADPAAAPADRLAAMAGAYVAFAAQERARFQILFAAGIDKDRFPQVRAAGDAALAVVVEVAATVAPEAAEQLALDLWALAHGYASLLSDGALADHDIDGLRAAALAQDAALRLLTPMRAST